MSTVVSILCFIIIIGLVIFIHEFGHFLIAKKNGIGIVEFAVGMGPDIFSWVKDGTKYSVKWIPFGGYCMMLGEEGFLPDVDAEGEETVMDPEKAFTAKPVWVRIAAIAAGPIFNFLLALLLSVLLAALVGETTSRIGAIAPGYPGEEAGLQAGDVITKIDRTKMHFFKDISLYMTLHEGEEVRIEFIRDGEKMETHLYPKYDEEEGRYLIGIMSGPREENLGIGDVLKYGFLDLGYNTKIVIKSIGMLFTGKASVNDLSGPVGMAGMVNDIVEEVAEDTKEESFWTTFYWTLINLMNFALLISANLGVMNLIPIPGMDGGRLIFLLIELVRGKPVEKKKEGIVTIVGFIFLLLLMLFVFFNDIRKVFFGV